MPLSSLQSHQITIQDALVVYQLRVWLGEISPLIWRRLLVRSDSTIADLHCTLQIAMGWSDSHLHQFIIHGKRYGLAQPGGVGFSDDPHQVRLGDLGLRLKERFFYEYDFGDLWRHEIRVEQQVALVPKKGYPVCIGGARASPPEDCGGPWAFTALKQHYSPVYIAQRLLDLLDPGEAQTDLVDAQQEVRTFLYWLQADRFDRRAVNRRLKQDAAGDEAWVWL